MSAVKVYRVEKKLKICFERCFWEVRIGALGFHHITHDTSHTHSPGVKCCMKYLEQCQAKTPNRDETLLGFIVIVVFMHCEHNKVADICCSSYYVILTICWL